MTYKKERIKSEVDKETFLSLIVLSLSKQEREREREREFRIKGSRENVTQM
jgi:hypothetical protein